MKTLLISMAISALVLAPCVIRADVAVPPQPPHEMVLKGTLAWDGKAEKRLLKLTRDDETIPLGSVDKIKETTTGKPFVPETYIGKKVAVTLIGTRPPEGVSSWIKRKDRGGPPPPIELKKVISLTLVKEPDPGK